MELEPEANLLGLSNVQQPAGAKLGIFYFVM